ncbi:uncharacterized protein si:dkey-204f11.3 [Triplophysa dalaica]|uniref:uncharacterized protein si:dkey-204f11.3 n=1 Tax=Triplophysa dalaica TaxID=1582913 RepID=UPI0024DF3F88|nr:uncharacterized protein si:dkey-204f11.3 [Triplophysa dalaica]
MEGFEFEIPNIEIPDIEIPDIEIPDIEIPDIEIGEMETAEIENPDMEFETEDRARRTNRNANRRVPQQVKGYRLVKVKDYIRCSVCTVTFCNFMFLGTSALICSLKAIHFKIRRDVSGGRIFGCCALTANIVAIIGTIICIIVFAVILVSE